MSRYGAIDEGVRSNGGSGAEGREEDALLPGHTRQRTMAQRVHRHLTVNIDKGNADLVLLLCYTITGLLDSSATAAWGSFVSMQTGNTIYFGLGVANPSDGTRWIKSGLSIAMFALGSFCFSRFHRFFGEKKRWVLTTSYLFQLMMIVISASIAMNSTAADDAIHDLHWHVLLPLAMVAFQSSGQAVTSRVLEQGGLTSVVLTSIYCDLFSDAKLFTWSSENKQRNRRAAAPVLLFIGALGGGFWSKSNIGVAGSLWTAAVLKAGIVVAWLLWKEDPEQDKPLPS